MNDLILEESVICQYGYDLNGFRTDVMQTSPILNFIKTYVIKNQLENGAEKNHENFLFITIGVPDLIQTGHIPKTRQMHSHLS